MNRRGFLLGMLAAGAAPAIVKASNLMPVFARAESGLIVPAAIASGNTLITIDMIIKEALRLAHQNESFIGTLNRQFDERFAAP